MSQKKFTPFLQFRFGELSLERRHTIEKSIWTEKKNSPTPNFVNGRAATLRGTFDSPHFTTFQIARERRPKQAPPGEEAAFLRICTILVAAAVASINRKEVLNVFLCLPQSSVRWPPPTPFGPSLFILEPVFAIDLKRTGLHRLCMFCIAARKVERNNNAKIKIIKMNAHTHTHTLRNEMVYFSWV